MSSTLIDQTLAFVPARHRKQAVRWGLVILVVAFIAAGAWTLYGRSVDARNAMISEQYWLLTSAIDSEDLDSAEQAFSVISEQGTDEQFNFAAMVLAAGSFSNDKLDRAEELYREVIARASLLGMRDAARTRLAKVLLTSGRFNDAKQELIEIESVGPHFSIVVSDLLGDIAVAEGELEVAESHYGEALSILSEGGDEDLSTFLQTKLSMIASLRLQGASLQGTSSQ